MGKLNTLLWACLLLPGSVMAQKELFLGLDVIGLTRPLIVEIKEPVSVSLSAEKMLGSKFSAFAHIQAGGSWHTDFLTVNDFVKGEYHVSYRQKSGSLGFRYYINGKDSTCNCVKKSGAGGFFSLQFSFLNLTETLKWQAKDTSYIDYSLLDYQTTGYQYGITLGAGYKFLVKDKFFIEPSAWILPAEVFTDWQGNMQKPTIYTDPITKGRQRNLSRFELKIGYIIK